MKVIRTEVKSAFSSLVMPGMRMLRSMAQAMKEMETVAKMCWAARRYLIAWGPAVVVGYCDLLIESKDCFSASMLVDFGGVFTRSAEIIRNGICDNCWRYESYRSIWLSAYIPQRPATSMSHAWQVDGRLWSSRELATESCACNAEW